MADRQWEAGDSWPSAPKPRTPNQAQFPYDEVPYSHAVCSYGTYSESYKDKSPVVKLFSEFLPNLSRPGASGRYGTICSVHHAGRHGGRCALSGMSEQRREAPRLKRNALSAGRDVDVCSTSTLFYGVVADPPRLDALVA